MIWPYRGWNRSVCECECAIVVCGQLVKQRRCWIDVMCGGGGWATPRRTWPSRAQSRRDPRFFCLPFACSLPASLQRRMDPCILNCCPFWLALVTCGEAWAILHPAVPALTPGGFRFGVESGSIPLARQRELNRPPCASPVVQWEGSVSLVISSRQPPSTTHHNPPSRQRGPLPR